MDPLERTRRLSNFFDQAVMFRPILSQHIDSGWRASWPSRDIDRAVRDTRYGCLSTSKEGNTSEGASLGRIPATCRLAFGDTT